MWATWERLVRTSAPPPVIVVLLMVGDQPAP